VKKNYQTTGAAAPIDELVMPEAVTLAMSELTGAVKEGLLALAVGAGLGVLQVLMEEGVTAVAGPKGRHDSGRVANPSLSVGGSASV
jgi:putative transposase